MATGGIACHCSLNQENPSTSEPNNQGSINMVLAAQVSAQLESMLSRRIVSIAINIALYGNAPQWPGIYALNTLYLLY